MEGTFEADAASLSAIISTPAPPRRPDRRGMVQPKALFDTRKRSNSTHAVEEFCLGIRRREFEPLRTFVIISIMHVGLTHQEPEPRTEQCVKDAFHMYIKVFQKSRVELQ